MRYIIFYYVIIINLVTLIVFGIDKYKAKKGAWRIPEATLFILSIAGGSLGALCAMFLFRHKTQHWTFLIGIPLILVVQIVLTVMLVMR